MLLQEAIWIFEDFIISIQILQKPPPKEEIEIIRNSIFKVAVALEVFALNYGKHQMIGANSSVEINSRKLGESGFDLLVYWLTLWPMKEWLLYWFNYFFSWDLLISAVAGSSWFIPPVDHLFLSILVIMDNFFGD